jgi:hypothetical protein
MQRYEDLVELEKICMRQARETKCVMHQSLPAHAGWLHAL